MIQSSVSILVVCEPDQCTKRQYIRSRSKYLFKRELIKSSKLFPYQVECFQMSLASFSSLFLTTKITHMYIRNHYFIYVKSDKYIYIHTHTHTHIYTTYIIFIFNHTTLMKLLASLSTPSTTTAVAYNHDLSIAICHHNLTLLMTIYHHHTLHPVICYHHGPPTTIIDHQQSITNINYK